MANFLQGRRSNQILLSFLLLESYVCHLSIHSISRKMTLQIPSSLAAETEISAHSSHALEYFFCTMSAEEKTFILFVTRRIPLLRRVLQEGVGVCLELLFLSVWDPSIKSIKSLGKGEWGHFGKPGVTHFRLLSVRLSSFSHLLLQKKDFLFFPPPPKKNPHFPGTFFLVKCVQHAIWNKKIPKCPWQCRNQKNVLYSCYFLPACLPVVMGKCIFEHLNDLVLYCTLTQSHRNNKVRQLFL